MNRANFRGRNGTGFAFAGRGAGSEPHDGTRQVDDSDQGQAMGSLKDQIQGAVRDAAQAVKASTRSGAGANINVAGRTNTVVSHNVGSDGETHLARSRQHVRIRQNGETVEESVVEKVDTGEGGR